MQELITQLYNCKKVYGPYLGKDGRKRCVLYFQKGKTVSKQYARLLLEVKLGRLLTENEEADHIDEDLKNDSIENLQVLSKEDHKKKSGMISSLRTSQRLKMICPECSKEFECRQYRAKLTAKPCCSRSCTSKFNGANQYKKFREAP